MYTDPVSCSVLLVCVYLWRTWLFVVLYVYDCLMVGVFCAFYSLSVVIQLVSHNAIDIIHY